MKTNREKSYDCPESVSREMILKELKSQAEESYRMFSSKLLPPGERVLGVRLPILRKMAGRLAKGAWEDYLRQAGDEFFEETMLQGMVIGTVKTDWEGKKKWMEWFLPKVENWSVCDSFCSSLKGVDKEKLRTFLAPYMESKKEYEVRFALVMYLMHLTGEEEFPHVWEGICHMKPDGYYAKMAAAWAVSIYFREHPALVMPYLEQPSGMDPWIYRKSLQKIMESRAVDAEQKEQIRRLQKGRK